MAAIGALTSTAAAEAPLFEVKVTQHHGRTYKHPGHTTIKVSVEEGYGEEWTVTMKQTVAGHHYPTEPFPRNSEDELEGEIEWSCDPPGVVVDNTITAHGPQGQTLTRTLHIKTASHWWCKQVRLDESQERRENIRQKEVEQQEKPRSDATKKKSNGANGSIGNPTVESSAAAS